MRRHPLSTLVPLFILALSLGLTACDGEVTDTPAGG